MITYSTYDKWITTEDNKYYNPYYQPPNQPTNQPLNDSTNHIHYNKLICQLY